MVAVTGGILVVMALIPAVALDRFGGSISFQHFPNWLQTICGSPITVTAIVGGSR